jgi:hypothetical protein
MPHLTNNSGYPRNTGKVKLWRKAKPSSFPSTLEKYKPPNAVAD